MPSRIGATQLEFELQVGDGRGVLLLRPATFFGWLQVDRLALAIPDVAFPLDITRGINQFKQYRCEVTSATLGLDEASSEGLLRHRAPVLAAAGFEEVRIRLLRDYVELSGRARVAGETADFSVRGHANVELAGLRLRLTDARAFGFLARPAPLLAHDLVCVLLGAVATQGGTDDDEAGATVTGLGDFRVAPLQLFLRGVFPPAGWRIPDVTTVQVGEFELGDSTADISYGATGPGADLPSDAEPVATPAAAAASASGGELAAELVFLDELRDADDALLRGDMDTAVAAYRFELSRDSPYARLLTERLLSVLCARASTLREADRMARSSLQRWPDFVPAHLALAAVATSLGDFSTAADHFAEVARLAEDGADDEEAVRAAMAAARQLDQHDPERATHFYRQVVDRRPNHHEAAGALAARYRAAGLWPELVQLDRQRIAGIAHAQERARAHLRLAEILHDQLGDLDQARIELEAAVALDDQHIQAWDELARTFEEMGRDSAAIEALTRIAALQQAKRDPLGQARTHARLADLYERLGNDEAAYQQSQQALELRPGDLELLARSALLAEQIGESDQAIATWERLIEIASPGDPQTRAANRLLPLLIESGDLERVRSHCRRFDVTVTPHNLVALASLEQAAGSTAEALETLAAAARGLSGVEAAEVLLQRARLLTAADDNDAALATFAEAHATAPDSDAGERAARDLLGAARAAANPIAERRWLTALVDGQRQLPDRPDLAIALARLDYAAGDPAVALARLRGAIEAGADPRESDELHAALLGAVGDFAGQARRLTAIAEATEDLDERAHILHAAIDAHLAANQAALALDCARSAMAILPDDRALTRAFAEAAWRAREWEDVATGYDALLPDAPPEEQLVCGFRLGMALERQGRREAALQCYLAVVDCPGAEGPAVAELWENLAALCVRLGDSRGAADAYARAAADPRTDQGPASRAQHHLRAAEILHRRLADPEQAVIQLEAALEILPNHLPALDALEWIHAEVGRYPEVAATLERKIQVAVNQPQLQSLLGRLLTLQAGVLAEPDAARSSAQRLLEMNPQSRSALTFLAADSHELGDFERAERLYARLVEATPADQRDRVAERISALSNLGTVRYQLGRHAEAELPLREALNLMGDALDPELIAVLEELYAAHQRWSELCDLLCRRATACEDPEQRRIVEARRAGILLHQVGDSAAAIAACQAALELWPDDLELADLLAAAEAEQQRTEVDREAIRAKLQLLTRELAMLPGTEVAQFTRLRHQLAELHIQLGELDPAREYLELVLAEEPTRIAAVELLIDLHSRTGRWQQAADEIARLSRLVESRERRAQLLFEMGEILRVRLGRGDDAGDAYLRASDLSPRHAPTLRRVADYYWETGDHAGVTEVAGELDDEDQLLVTATEPKTLARVAVAAALVGDHPLARRAAAEVTARHLGALIAVLTDLDDQRVSVAALAAAVSALCLPPGPSLVAVRTELGNHPAERARELGHALAQSGSTG